MLTPVSLAFFSLIVLGHGRSSPGAIALAIDEHSAVQGFAVLRGRDFRFPFMGPRDVQLGPVWTAEPFRRRGLAAGLCRLALNQVASPASVLWWLCRLDNQASKGVARALGLSVACSAARHVLPIFPMSYRYTLHPFPTGLTTDCMQ
jgi:RimJ/RimL family protein N-acetyltransferase